MPKETKERDEKERKKFMKPIAPESRYNDSGDGKVIYRRKRTQRKQIFLPKENEKETKKVKEIYETDSAGGALQ